MADIPAPLTEEELAAIRALDTPTISNALELTNTRPWTDGFTRPEIRCMFPEMETIVGYAVTVEIAAAVPGRKALPRDEYWEAIAATPAPRIVVLHDRDYPNPIGSFWGEVQGNIAKGLGCVGAITDGGVRDLNEVRALGFQFLASAVLVSHAYVHAETVGTTIEVGGLKVRPGDLIAADQHGAVQIPFEIARELPKLAAFLGEVEAVTIKAAQADVVTPDTLRAASAEVAKLQEHRPAY